MKEFDSDNYPPFLSEYESDERATFAIEATLAELTEKGIKFGDRVLNKKLIAKFGERRFFGIVNYVAESISPRTNGAIELDASEVREFIQLTAKQVDWEFALSSEEPEDWSDTPQGFKLVTPTWSC